MAIKQTAPYSRLIANFAMAGALFLTGCASDIPSPTATATPSIDCDTASQEEWQDFCDTAAPRDDEPAGAGSQSADAPIESTTPTAGLNQPFEFVTSYSDSARVDTWQVTLTQMKCGLKSVPRGKSNPKWDGGDEYPEYITAKPESGEEFCLAYWNWTNKGKTPASTTSAGDVLIGEERFAKGPDDEDTGDNVWRDEFKADFFHHVDINPRKSVRSIDLYSVPAGETPRAVLFPLTTVDEDSTMVISTT